MRPRPGHVACCLPERPAARVVIVTPLRATSTAANLLAAPPRAAGAGRSGGPRAASDDTLLGGPPVGLGRRLPPSASGARHSAAVTRPLSAYAGK